MRRGWPDASISNGDPHQRQRPPYGDLGQPIAAVAAVDEEAGDPEVRHLFDGLLPLLAVANVGQLVGQVPVSLGRAAVQATHRVRCGRASSGTAPTMTGMVATVSRTPVIDGPRLHEAVPSAHPGGQS